MQLEQVDLGSRRVSVQPMVGLDAASDQKTENTAMATSCAGL